MARGRYAEPSGKTGPDAFLILNFSPSEKFTRFSYEIRATTGGMIAYKRGIDELDTLEVALLRAWYEYDFPPHQWRLYPRDEIRERDFGNKPKNAREYWEARSWFCCLVRHPRHAAWFRSEEFRAQIGAKRLLTPLFELTQPVLPLSLKELSPENREISTAYLEFAKKQIR